VLFSASEILTLPFPLSRTPFQLLRGLSEFLRRFQLSCCFFLEVLLDSRETGLHSLQFAAVIPCGSLFHGDYGDIS